MPHRGMSCEWDNHYAHERQHNGECTQGESMHKTSISSTIHQHSANVLCFYSRPQNKRNRSFAFLVEGGFIPLASHAIKQGYCLKTPNTRGSCGGPDQMRKELNRSVRNHLSQPFPLLYSLPPVPSIYAGTTRLPHA